MNTFQIILTALISALVFIGVMTAQRFIRNDFLLSTKEMYEEGRMSATHYAACLTWAVVSAFVLLYVGVSSGVLFLLCVAALI